MHSIPRHHAAKTGRGFAAGRDLGKGHAFSCDCVYYNTRTQDKSTGQIELRSKMSFKKGCKGKEKLEIWWKYSRVFAACGFFFFFFGGGLVLSQGFWQLGLGRERIAMDWSQDFCFILCRLNAYPSSPHPPHPPPPLPTLLWMVGGIISSGLSVGVFEKLHIKIPVIWYVRANSGVFLNLWITAGILSFVQIMSNVSNMDMMTNNVRVVRIEYWLKEKSFIFVHF